MKHVHRKTDHGEVINYKHKSEVHRFPVPHEFGSNPDDTEVAQKNIEDRKRGINKQPWIGPLI